MRYVRSLLKSIIKRNYSCLPKHTSEYQKPINLLILMSQYQYLSTVINVNDASVFHYKARPDKVPRRWQCRQGTCMVFSVFLPIILMCVGLCQVAPVAHNYDTINTGLTTIKVLTRRKHLIKPHTQQVSNNTHQEGAPFNTIINTILNPKR